MIEVEEIMDESETSSPKEYIKSLNIPAILAFLPKFYEDMLQDPDARMYVQFCLYRGEWVIAGFRNGDGSLGTIPAVSDHYDKALFMKAVTDTGIGNKIHINDTSHLQNTPEAKAIKEGLKELFDCVFSACGAPMQQHRSVSWYVKGVKK